jgi:hypothetical protein
MFERAQCCSKIVFVNRGRARQSREKLIQVFGLISRFHVCNRTGHDDDDDDTGEEAGLFERIERVAGRASEEAKKSGLVSRLLNDSSTSSTRLRTEVIVHMKDLKCH